MEVVIKNKSKFCGNVCLTEDMKGRFLIVSDFMLGDADSYTTELQGSFKKVSKEMINIVIALECSENKYTEDINYEFLDLPYSESSYWSFDEYKVLYNDKYGEIFDVELEFNEDEKALIESQKILD